MSEGRGTTKPFELIGAPYIDPVAFCRELDSLDLPGVHFRACSFQPTFQKHAGSACGGVQIHITDREQFEPVITGVATVKVAHDLYPDRFLWKQPPYEYVYDKNPFDVIAGTASLREALQRGDSLNAIRDSWDADLMGFMSERSKYLLY
jgi:uncharacterized protein YbbC (DUF1343 family)